MSNPETAPEALLRELAACPEGPRKEELRRELAKLAALRAGATGEDGVRERDLRKVPCPLGWAKARMTLEALAPGELLRLKIGPGEPQENIPRQLAAEGFPILKRRKFEDGTAELLVRKPETAPGAAK